MNKLVKVKYIIRGTTDKPVYGRRWDNSQTIGFNKKEGRRTHPREGQTKKVKQTLKIKIM